MPLLYCWGKDKAMLWSVLVSNICSWALIVILTHLSAAASAAIASSFLVWGSCWLDGCWSERPSVDMFLFFTSLSVLFPVMSGRSVTNPVVVRSFSCFKFTIFTIFHYSQHKNISQTANKSSPKSFGKSVSLPSHQRMHSPTVCASYTTHNVMKLLRNVTEALWNVAEHCGKLQNVMGALWSRCGTLQGVTETLWSVSEPLQNVTEALRKRYGVLWSIMEHYEALWDIMGGYGTLQEVMEITEALQIITECYGSVTEPLQNITEPLQKISILPITN